LGHYRAEVSAHEPPGPAESRPVRPWREIIGPYAKPDARRGIIQLLNTGLPFLALVAAMLCGLDHDTWPALLLALPAAALLIRLFIIQHDCGHGSFFKARWANDLLGRVIGVLTLTPYTFWRRSHAIHHATSGNLSRRGVGDVDTLTVREYLARPWWGRLAYRLYRHPLVMFVVGPAYQFLLRHRVPTGHPIRQWANWLSVLGTNAALAAIVLLMAFTIGLVPFLVGYLPVILLAGSIGMWLFYVQHQFEDTYWEAEPCWDFHDAALQGCSFYDLPGLLRWITGHIGFHHIHHLSSKVPNYRLADCFAQNPELWVAKRLSLRDSLKCPRLTLWDEESRKLVSFAHLRRRASERQAPPRPA
jgi:omega-6 fatty acid desaturase (delta-12 desaturase)